MRIIFGIFLCLDSGWERFGTSGIFVKNQWNFPFPKVAKINGIFLFQKLQKSRNFPFPKVARINEIFLFQKLKKSLEFSFSKSCKNQ
jgi:hypothetical protein